MFLVCDKLQPGHVLHERAAVGVRWGKFNFSQEINGSGSSSESITKYIYSRKLVGIGGEIIDQTDEDLEIYISTRLYVHRIKEKQQKSLEGGQERSTRLSHG